MISERDCEMYTIEFRREITKGWKYNYIRDSIYDLRMKL